MWIGTPEYQEEQRQGLAPSMETETTVFMAAYDAFLFGWSEERVDHLLRDRPDLRGEFEEGLEAAAECFGADARGRGWAAL